MNRREGASASGFPFLDDVGLVAGECGMTERRGGGRSTLHRALAGGNDRFAWWGCTQSALPYPGRLLLRWPGGSGPGRLHPAHPPAG